jgi:hypothetical protein
MNKSILIHNITKLSGGFGDFIRAGISLYAFCRVNNIEYYIYFDDNEYFKECFLLDICYEYENYKNNSQKELYEIEEVNLMNMLSYNNVFETFFNKILNFNKIYIVISNSFNFYETKYINKFKNDFFTKKLKPSNKLEEYIQKYYNKYGLIENNYISVHVRCGDKIMCLNDNNIKSVNDVRIDINSENTYLNLIKYIENIKNIINIKIPVVIHSDSNLFKKKIKEYEKEYIVLDTNLFHHSESIGVNNEKSNFDTYCEFFIIARANCIFTYGLYSGYSYFASIINNKKLFVTHVNNSIMKLNNDIVVFN